MDVVDANPVGYGMFLVKNVASIVPGNNPVTQRNCASRTKVKRGTKYSVNVVSRLLRYTVSFKSAYDANEASIYTLMSRWQQ